MLTHSFSWAWNDFGSSYSIGFQADRITPGILVCSGLWLLHVSDVFHLGYLSWFASITGKASVSLHGSQCHLRADSRNLYPIRLDNGKSRPLASDHNLDAGGINIVFNVFLWGRFEFFHLFTYLFMGWLILFFWRDLRAAVSLNQIWWMLTGGFFIRRECFSTL